MERQDAGRRSLRDLTSPVTIGVLGGVGPFGGVDLVSKIGEEAGRRRDQDHPNLILFSLPAAVPDRTDFLLGREPRNPGDALATMAVGLADLGCREIAVACNTAHATPIWSPIASALRSHSGRPTLFHIMDEVAGHLRREQPEIRRVGVLSTSGARLAGCYPDALARVGIESVLPADAIQQECVHRAIYDPEVGLKARQPATPQARILLSEACWELRNVGAEAIILGCSELPLAFPDPTFEGIALIDSNRVLARALLRAAVP